MSEPQRRQRVSPGAADPGATAATPRLDADDDLAVARRVLAGDATAIDTLLDRLACLPAMVRVRHRRMGAPLGSQELDDVVQSVLLAVWRKLDRYEGRVPLLFWAAGFGIVELRKTCERRARRREVADDGLPEPAAAVTPEPLDRERLLQCLAELGPPEGDIVAMKHLEGLTFEGIAGRTGLVVNTVKTKYYRALERLRERLANRQEEMR